MNYVICPICNGQLRKTDKISVLVLSIDSSGDNGEYNLIPDFVDNEIVCHQQCLEKAVPNLNGILSKVDHAQNKIDLKEQLCEVLKALKINASQSEIDSFVSNNGNINSIDELTRLWFFSRNTIY
jgi:hypothetical protein